MYYNSNIKGARFDSAAATLNFGTWKFVSWSGGSAGAGQYVKNNSASAENWDHCLIGRVWFNSNQQGVYDDVEAWSWRNLTQTYNENASMSWPKLDPDGCAY